MFGRLEPKRNDRPRLQPPPIQTPSSAAAQSASSSSSSSSSPQNHTFLRPHVPNPLHHPTADRPTKALSPLSYSSAPIPPYTATTSRHHPYTSSERRSSHNLNLPYARPTSNPLPHQPTDQASVGRHGYATRFVSQRAQSESHRPPPETSLAAGSAYGQINLLADVAARQAEQDEHEEQKKNHNLRFYMDGKPGDQQTEVSDWPVVRNWYTGQGRPNVQERHSGERSSDDFHQLPSAASPSQQLLSGVFVPPTVPGRHPLSGLTLDKEYRPYVPYQQANEVRKVFNTPTLSTQPPPFRRNPTSSLSPHATTTKTDIAPIPPQWPPSTVQIHGKAEPHTGRAWIYSLDENKPDTAGALPNSTGQKAISVPSITQLPRQASGGLISHLPTPISSLPQTKIPSSDATQIDDTPFPPKANDGKENKPDLERDCVALDSDEDMSSTTTPISTSVRIRLQRPTSLPTMKSLSRAHSSSLSSTASVPLPRNDRKVSISPSYSLPLVRPRTVSETPSIESIKFKRREGKRDKHKRKEQNAPAQRKHRDKKRVKVEEMESELMLCQARLAIRDRELAARDKELAARDQELEKVKEERDGLKRIVEESTNSQPSQQSEESQPSQFKVGT